MRSVDLKHGLNNKVRRRGWGKDRKDKGHRDPEAPKIEVPQAALKMASNKTGLRAASNQAGRGLSFRARLKVKDVQGPQAAKDKGLLGRDLAEKGKLHKIM